MTRYEANKKILEILSKYIENNPEQRFVQILWNLDLINIGNSELIEDRYNEDNSLYFNCLYNISEQLNIQYANNINVTLLTT